MSERVSLPDFERTSGVMLAFVCGAIILFRLFLPALLKDSFSDVYDTVANGAVVSMIFAAGCFYIIRQRIIKQEWTVSGFELSFGGLMLAAGYSLSHSAYPEGSFSSFLVLLSYLVFFYILLDLFKNDQTRNILLIFIGIGIFTVGILGIWEYFLPKSSYLHGTDKFLPGRLPYRRVGSVFNAPNVLAGFYLLVLPFLGGFYLEVKSLRSKAALGILIVISLTAFLMTLSFLCVLNLLISAFILWALLKKAVSVKSRMWLGLFLGGLAGLLCLIILKRHDFSVESRLEYLTAAVSLLKTHPWIGNGWDTFRYLSPQYTHHQTYSGYVHNSYLQIWVETGVLGFIAVLLLVTTLIRRILKAAKTMAKASLLVGLSLGLMAFYVDNLTNMTMLSPDISLFGWIALAFFCGITGSPNPDKKSPPNVTWIILLAILGLLLAQTVLKTGASLYCQQAVDLINQRKYPEAFQWINKAKSWDPSNQNYHAMEGLTYLKVYEVISDPSFLEKARIDFQKAADLSPYYYVNYVMLGKIAWKQKDPKKAQAYLEKAGQLCPWGYSFFKQDIFSGPTGK